MFDGCSIVTELDVNNFKTSNILYFKKMFNSCSALESVDIECFRVPVATTLTFIFNGCQKLATLKISSSLKTLKFSSSFDCNVSKVSMKEFMSYCGGNNPSSSKGSLYCSDAAWTALTANSSITGINTEK